MSDRDQHSRKAFRGETDIIQSVFAPLARGEKGAFGLVDDAALHSVRDGEETVLTTDMIVEDVHILAGGRPADIGYRALAVNVSDLVAKGADPDIYLLSIALPGRPDRGWLEDLGRGLAEAQTEFGCTLAGGDTVATPGPLTLSITALGRVPENGMVLRSGARPGDRVYVTGTIGDAVAGLKVLRDGDDVPSAALGAADREYLAGRYWRPAPRPALAPVLREYAHAAMDISDGLAGDFAKLCGASGCGGTIEAEKVPLSKSVRTLLQRGHIGLEDILSGGDDYELLAAVSSDACRAFEAAMLEHGATATQIGSIEPDSDIVVLGKNGEPMQLSTPSFDHF